MKQRAAKTDICYSPIPSKGEKMPLGTWYSYYNMEPKIAFRRFFAEHRQKDFQVTNFNITYPKYNWR